MRIDRASDARQFARHHACEDWLRGYGADGPKPAKEPEQTALAGSDHLFERARARLAVRALRSGIGKGACYHLCLPESDYESSDHPESVAGAHAPHFSVSDSRVEHVEHVEHGRPIGPAPDAGWTSVTGAAPIGDEVASATESV